MNLPLIGAFLYLACGGAILLLGVLVLRASPGERLNRITAGMMLFGGLGPLVGGLGLLLPVYGKPAIEGGLLAEVLNGTWEFFFPTLLLFSLAFPRERPVLKRFGRFSWTLFAPHLVHIVLLIGLPQIALAIARWRAGAAPRSGVIDETVGYAGALVEVSVNLLTKFHTRLFSFVDIAFTIAAILILWQSLRAMRSPKIRQQLSVILFGLGTCVGLYAIAVPLPTILSVALPASLRVVLISVAVLVGTASIAFAIVSRSFLDVGSVVRRGILLSSFTAVLVFAYFITARELDEVLAQITGADIPVLRTLFVIVAIVFFHPLLGRLDRGADRFLAGDRTTHRNVLEDLGRQMTTILDIDVLRQRVLGTLRDALAVDHAHLILREEGDFLVWGRGEEAEGRLSGDHPLAAGIAAAEGPILTNDIVVEIADEKQREAADRTMRELHSRLVVPIRLIGSIESPGFLSFGPKVTGNRFTGDEVTLLSILATQIGIAVQNARFHEDAVERAVVDEELAMARSIQETIFAGRSRSFPAVDVAAVSVPSRQVGGDYYDLISVADGGVAVAIGDVAGKGVPAALLMSMLHAALHAQVNGTVAIAPTLSRMNRILCGATATDKFATFFFGVLDPSRGMFRFANGGHNFPILLRADGSVERLEAGGLILGLFADSDYEEKEVAFDAGDLLVFFTDGVTEEEHPDDDDELFGEDRLLNVVREHRHDSAEQLVSVVRQEVAAFRGSQAFSDDFTLIVLRPGAA